jgi:hypothetical protein
MLNIDIRNQAEGNYTMNYQHSMTLLDVWLNTGRARRIERFKTLSAKSINSHNWIVTKTLKPISDGLIYSNAIDSNR